MRKFISFALALAVILAIPGVAQAKKADKPFEGKVTAIDTTANTITIAKGKKDSQVFKAAGATVTVDGASAKLSDITVGMRAKVTVGATADTATAIAATTHKKEGKKNKHATPTPTPAST
ncbi:MAG TPA: hypothetical protein VG733_03995 [Chthoniobacteraceae bacterium]|nr:hypothetical protein [Chthoniobacteraceae bacterium]